MISKPRLFGGVHTYAYLRQDVDKVVVIDAQCVYFLRKIITENN